MRKYKIEGMEELQKSIRKLEKLPQKCVTKAARSGASIALKAAKKYAPVETGNLKKGIVLKGEKITKKGKKVYDITMDSKMNDIFQKTTKTGLRRRVLKRKVSMAKGGYYYPASQEFGFQAVNGKYIPGFNYLKKSIEENVISIEIKIVEVLSKEIDKI